MDRSSVLRIARPTDNLEKIVEMYCRGLGYKIIASFNDHAGFDGTILGIDSHNYHLEFTHCRGHSAGKAPTEDNLLVFYVPDKVQWLERCMAMESAGFLRVNSFNPYWDVSGKTFQDIDGYRVVIQNEAWQEN